MKGRSNEEILNSLEIRVPGRFYLFELDTLRIMSDSTAIIFGELLNLYYANLDHRRNERGGWAFITNKQLQRRLPHSRAKLQRALLSLQRIGVISTKRLGIPPRRMIRINVKKLNVMLQQVRSKDYSESRCESRCSSSESRCSIVSGLTQLNVSGLTQLDYENSRSDCGVTAKKLHFRKSLRSTKKEVRPPSAPPLKNDDDDLYQELAARFTAAHQSVRKINSISNPKLWWVDFKRLHAKTGESATKVKQVVLWYCRLLEEHGDPNKNSSGCYPPIIWHPKTFIKKWEQLLDAIQRDSKEQEEEAPQIAVKRGVAKRKMSEDDLIHRLGV